MTKYSIPVWKMVVSTFEKSDEYVTIKEIVKKIQDQYPSEKVNKMTIRLQTIFHCVNHPGRRNDISKRYVKNPLFFTDDKGGFRLLHEKEKKQYQDAL